METKLKSVDAFLEASAEMDQIFVTHDAPDGMPCGYLYVSDEKTQAGPTCAYPVTAQEVYEMGLLEWDTERQGWLMDRRIFIPASYDFKKIRRRLEDCLRKTTDENLLLELALRVNVRID